MTAPSDDKQGNPPSPRLLDEIRNRIRSKHYSRRTEESYTHWIKRFILFHHKRHPREMGAPEVEAFLSSLAVDRQVAASTQRQALAAILFLYKEVLVIDLPWLDGITRAKERVRLPVVLSGLEVERLLALLQGTHGLMARLLYGTGMRLMECLRLRVKDVDFERHELTVREGKGGTDRVAMPPLSISVQLAEHLEHVRALCEVGRGVVSPLDR